MASHFKTIGPLELQRTAGKVTSSSLASFWKQANDLKPGLSKGVGVYILGTGKGDALTPWYVGKSDNGFKGRLSIKHHAYELIEGNQPRGNLYIFFFPRISAKTGALRKPSKKKFVERGDDVRGRRRPSKSIRTLEFLLIGSCLACNPELVNAKEKTFQEGLFVPGFFKDDRDDISEPVVSLRKMLERWKAGK